MSVSSPGQQNGKSLPMSQTAKLRQAVGSGPPGPGTSSIRPEDRPDTPEYKKKQAMLKGPVLELARDNTAAYGMDECTFTGLKDIFRALMESGSRTGVLSPQRFLEIFKRDNEMFRNSMHQDAHEFYGLVLNDVIANVEDNARRMQERRVKEEKQTNGGQDGLAQSVQNVLGSAAMVNSEGEKHRLPGTGWVHDIFEGVLTSETKCLTCETASQRDETFLDLSIDLEEHSSVTSCLRKFSAEEMLCERNKFHCDHCGGLQEAEKRMKVKRLPKVLTLHLKRFKYTEDYSRLQKLFHRVVYPYHLRMFNTTDEASDPDRLYELYAVVVHIGGNAYHGHYVSIIKTKQRGWVLFDDEMVEPVDKHFVRNFFGDKPGMATAYVLFYQETTFDKVREEQEREGMEEVKLATEAAHMANEGVDKSETASLTRQTTQPTLPTSDPDSAMSKLAHAKTAPEMPISPPAGSAAPTLSPMAGLTKLMGTKPDARAREERKREKKEREALDKAARQAEKEKEKEAKEEEKRRRWGEPMKRSQDRNHDHLGGEQDESSLRAHDTDKTATTTTTTTTPTIITPTTTTSTAGQGEGEAKKRDGEGSHLSATPSDRSKRSSRTVSRRSFGFFTKDRGNGEPSPEGREKEATPEKADKTRARLGVGLGRKKSNNAVA